MEQISRAEAKELNLKRYFTGTPCNKNGHIAERFVSTWCCVDCVNDRKKSYYKNNKASCDSRDSKWKKENKHLVNNHSKKWYDNNTDYCVELTAQRRAAEKQALPSWYESEKMLITNLYKKAKQLTTKSGIQYHVDHIVPLRNDQVCGLHCMSNLQILTEKENLTKSNKF